MINLLNSIMKSSILRILKFYNFRLFYVFRALFLSYWVYTIYTRQETIYNLKLFHSDDEKKISNFVLIISIYSGTEQK